MGRKRKSEAARTTSTGIVCDSGFESRVIQDLIDRGYEQGVDFIYQPGPFKYTTPVRSTRCLDCESEAIVKDRSYTADVQLLSSGLLVEIKGYFQASLRTLLREFMKSRADLRLAFVFEKDNWQTKAKKRAYSDYAEAQKSKWAIGYIPEEWFDVDSDAQR